MMEEAKRRSARARPLAEVHDARACKDAFQHVGLEPVIEEVGDRHRQKPHQRFHILTSQPPHPEGNSGDACKLAQVPRKQVRRGRNVNAFQHPRESPHARAELRPPRGIARAESPD